MDEIREIEFNYDSFKQISYDRANGKNLVESEIKAIDFDNFVQALSVATYKSVDAIYIHGNNYDLIEFKNTNVDDMLKTNHIIEKYKDTIMLLSCRGISNIYVELTLVISHKKNINNMKRLRQTAYVYKQRLFYYASFISRNHYNNPLEINFKFLTEEEFDEKYRK